jgi:Ca2+-binding RTX toxin-like protein
VHTTLASYTLGNHVENGRILATGAANLTGNALNNLLYAGTGNNVLDGGAGSDTVTWAYAVSGAAASPPASPAAAPAAPAATP